MKPLIKTVGSILACLMLPLSASAAASVRVYTTQEQLAGPRLHYSAACPRVDGVCDEQAENRLNIRLKETADSAKLSARLAAQAAGAGEVRGSFTFSVPRNRGGFASIVTRQELEPGAGKTTLRQTALTFQTVTGRELSLHDLFRDGVDVRATLGDIVRRQIAARRLTDRQTQPYAALGYARQFYLTSDSLVLFVEPGQCFPVSDGVVEFRIPLRTLDGCLKPEFLL